MDLNTAEACLKNNTIRFRKPSEWKDPYESRYYLANYDNVIKEPFNRDLFACCFTKQNKCEAAWKMYKADNSPCVKFCICIGQLRKFLDIYAYQHNAGLYEGNIYYGLKDDVINTLYKKSSDYYHVLFDDFNLKSFLNLMMIKRDAFSYEQEMRFLLNGDSLCNDEDFINVPIPWNLCLKKICYNGDMTDDEIERLKIALESNRLLCKKQYSLYHDFFLDPEKEDIYEKKQNILTIE